MIATANNVPVVSCRIELPLIGAWVATLSVDAPNDVKLTGAIVIALGAMTFRGARARGRADEGSRVEIVVVGGAGGLGKVLPARSYRGVPIRVPLVDLAAASGETLAAATIGPSFGSVLPAYVSTRATATAGVQALADAGGVAWRVLADGTLFVGPETWPASKAKTSTVRIHARDTRLELDCPAFDLVPGTTLDGRRIGHVTHVVDPPKARTYADVTS